MEGLLKWHYTTPKSNFLKQHQNLGETNLSSEWTDVV